KNPKMFTSARFCLFLLVSTVALSAAAVPSRERRDATGPVSSLSNGTAAENLGRSNPRYQYEPNSSPDLLSKLFAAYITILEGFPLVGPTFGGILSAANPGGLVKTIGGSVDTLTNPLIGTLGGLPGIIPGAVQVTGATVAPGAPVTTTAKSA
ncbi:hypothetical protein PRIPAC_72503, partial [Pristionchus pacificus]|uniref:Uncharacterized protein n=1 Tax=Pristionchus pacificus TaxID=54126 RepID=A0A2A6C7D2_PRIPA